MKGTWRYLETHNAHPRVNMALDAALFEHLRDTPLLRLYSWEKSCTIGRFQEASLLPFHDVAYSRRMTGGGVLLHGFDLSYTVMLPITMLGKKSVKASYEYLCSFLLHFYKSLGLEVGYAKDLVPLAHSPFCQVGFEAYDLIIAGKKIGGNAQKRSRDKLLQHGSIPLLKDTRELSGCSLEELGIRLDAFTCKERLLHSFQETFGVNFTETKLTEEEQHSFDRLYKDYYNDEEWQRTFKKTTVAS